jgi:hypothetical protein
MVLSVPTPDHVVMVIDENHAYQQIIGSAAAPYINSLAAQGATFTNSFAIEHPSQPNYLDLFSGSNQGITSDSCPHTFTLTGEYVPQGFTFGGYSEDMPSVGYTGCTYQGYARKHNPWIDFTNVPAGDNLPFAGYFPSDYSTLPTIAVVVPNLTDDMHNGTIQQGDTWLSNNLDSYVQWTYQNNSLFILTFDEDDSLHGNHITTIFVGPMVVPGQYAEHINHFNVLRTLEDMYGLPYQGASANVDPITDVWVPSGSPALAGLDTAPPLDAAVHASQPRFVVPGGTTQGLGTPVSLLPPTLPSRSAPGEPVTSDEAALMRSRPQQVGAGMSLPGLGGLDASSPDPLALDQLLAG